MDPFCWLRLMIRRIWTAARSRRWHVRDLLGKPVKYLVWVLTRLARSEHTERTYWLVVLIESYVHGGWAYPATRLVYWLDHNARPFVPHLDNGAYREVVRDTDRDFLYPYNGHKPSFLLGGGILTDHLFCVCQAEDNKRVICQSRRTSDDVRSHEHELPMRTVTLVSLFVQLLL